VSYLRQNVKIWQTLPKKTPPEPKENILKYSLQEEITENVHKSIMSGPFTT
jgi:hypothetical protein